MELPLTGGCRCGKLRYQITEAPRLPWLVAISRPGFGVRATLRRRELDSNHWSLAVNSCWFLTGTGEEPDLKSGRSSSICAADELVCMNSPQEETVSSKPISGGGLMLISGNPNVGIAPAVI